MGAKTRTVEMSEEDYLRYIFHKTLSETRRKTNQKISYEDLQRKVLAAAQEIGVEGLIVKEWDPNTIYSFGTCAVVREAQFDGKLGRRSDTDLDLGYFRKKRKGYTADSFEYNHWVFTAECEERFTQALEKQGLEINAYRCLSTITVSKQEHARRDRRDELALYR